MTTLNDVGVQINSTGILHPKLKNKFRVLFVDANEERTSFTNALAQQVVRFGSIPFHVSGDTIAGGHTWADFEDDMSNSVSEGLFRLLKEPFTVQLDQMDGDDQVIRRTILEGCKAWSILQSEHDYASSEACEFTLEFGFTGAKIL